ncbi:MAG: radical SAM protein [Verrucomicrobiae bacterium]|nr:radical SAM protein [Verrucomicrobiae bacterium]
MSLLKAHRFHPRDFESFRYVYPVISRRSRGLSIGLNVNPDKRCNFDCIYCQVNRTVPSAVNEFDLTVAEQELRAMLDWVRDGRLREHPQFAGVPEEKLQLRDIALSGDGEPTTLPNFSDTIAMIARVKPPGCKIVLITDAAGLDRADVRRGLAIMDQHEGEVWGKLDAGTPEYYRLVNRTAVPFERVLKNLALTARDRPIVIQSLFMKIHGEGPSETELAAYCQRLRDIRNIRLVQVYTVARRPMTLVEGVPAWQFVTALSNAEVDVITARVRRETGLTAESFYGE